MPEEEFIINVFCLIYDLFQHLFPNPLRTRDYEPKLSDSEVITIEIVSEWLGHHKDKDIYPKAGLFIRRVKALLFKSIVTTFPCNAGRTIDNPGFQWFFS